MTPELEVELLAQGIEHVFGGDRAVEGSALRDWLEAHGVRLCCEHALALIDGAVCCSHGAVDARVAAAAHQWGGGE